MLTQLNLHTNLSWMLEATNSFGTTTVEGPDSLSFNLRGVSVSTFNQLFAMTYTIAAAGNQTIDLTALTNLVGESVNFTHILAIMLTTSGGSITIKPGAANGFPLKFGGTTPTWTVADGGMLAFSEKPTATGIVVDGTHKNITLANTGGTTSIVQIVIVGSA